jgi:hypothetical protein
MGLKMITSYREYLEKIKEIENEFDLNFLEFKQKSQDELSEYEIKQQIIYSAMMSYMNYVPNAEVMDIAENVLKELQAASKDEPLSSEFINSLFNFDNVYIPLYDLLDLATNWRYKGESMSEDYRKGILDSIVSLRRYQRFSGFGDREWEKPENSYNTAIDR